jgi:hypothetical protein
MILARRPGAVGLALGFAAALLSSVVAYAQGNPGKEAPTGGAPEGAPRSRLVLSGSFEVDANSQKSFFLGARTDTTGKGEFDAFWTQRLTLRPRLILADDLNITLKMDLAHGVWGLPGASPDSAANLTLKRKDFLDLRVDQAYLSYRHRRTATRWYLGRQQFALGNLLVLDEDAPGLQVWRDFGPTTALGLGFAKESESGTIADQAWVDTLSTPRRLVDGRDADLFLGEVRLGRDNAGFLLNPFAAYYVDRSNADGTTILPDGHELQARFRPNISQATVIGIAASRAGKSLRIDAELDILSGADRVPGDTTRPDSGPHAIHDVNNGDLKGKNIYGRLAWTGSRLELAGTYASGSGDPHPFRAEGNINALHTQGRWFLTEVWGNGLSLEDIGIAPQGLANPDVRGYRGLENTTAIQALAACRVRANLKVGVSWTMLRATQPLRPWRDTPVLGEQFGEGDGIITPDEYDHDPYGDPLRDYPGSQSTDLGVEIDGRIDLALPDHVTVTLRGGSFAPGPAAGYLINGTSKFNKKPMGLRLDVTVPIPEFSLGG